MSLKGLGLLQNCSWIDAVRIVNFNKGLRAIGEAVEAGSANMYLILFFMWRVQAVKEPVAILVASEALWAVWCVKTL